MEKEYGEHSVESKPERLMLCEVASDLYLVFIEASEQLGDESEKAEKKYGSNYWRHPGENFRAAQELRDEALINLKDHGNNCSVCQKEKEQNSDYADIFKGGMLKGYKLKDNT